METSTSGNEQQTVVALFEDIIDAERALVELRKAEPTPAQVSLVLHDTTDDDAAEEDQTGAVARSLVANELDAVGDWLRGLSSVIIPECGAFLVAGPIGAVLTGISTAEIEADADANAAANVDHRAESITHTLTDFGFSDGEASYIDHRMQAGSILVGVTSGDETTLQVARRVYASHAAVYIGQTRTAAAVFDEATALLAIPPEMASGDAVTVTDAVAPLQRLSAGGGTAEAAALRNQEVVDSRGRPAGTVEDVLIEVRDPDGPSGPEPERQIIRYLIIGFGGLLGLGRHHVAVPVELVDAGGGPVRLRIDQNVLKHTPPYDDDAPFSRREELALLAFFGLQPYWLNEKPVAPPNRASS